MEGYSKALDRLREIQSRRSAPSSDQDASGLGEVPYERQRQLDSSWEPRAGKRIEEPERPRAGKRIEPIGKEVPPPLPAPKAVPRFERGTTQPRPDAQPSRPAYPQPGRSSRPSGRTGRDEDIEPRLVFEDASLLSPPGVSQFDRPRYGEPDQGFATERGASAFPGRRAPRFTRPRRLLVASSVAVGVVVLAVVLVVSLSSIGHHTVALSRSGSAKTNGAQSSQATRSSSAQSSSRSKGSKRSGSRSVVRSHPAGPSSTGTGPVMPVTYTTTSANYELAAPANGSPASFSFQASAPCWFEVRSGGSAGPILWTQTLDGGQSHLLSATGTIWVRIGSLAGSVQVNGRQVSFPTTYSTPFDMVIQIS